MLGSFLIHLVKLHMVLSEWISEWVNGKLYKCASSRVIAAVHWLLSFPRIPLPCSSAGLGNSLLTYSASSPCRSGTPEAKTIAITTPQLLAEIGGKMFVPFISSLKSSWKGLQERHRGDVSSYGITAVQVTIDPLYVPPCTQQSVQHGHSRGPESGGKGRYVNVIIGRTI